MAYVVGVDPGPVPGVVGLWIVGNQIERVDVVQCSAAALLRVLGGLTAGMPGVRIALERFVNGPRSSRLNAAGDAQTTRAMCATVAHWAKEWRHPLAERQASDVMPWASDTRMIKAGLIGPTEGMRHARAAARHALYAAVLDCGVPDPLSKRAKPVTSAVWDRAEPR